MIVAVYGTLKKGGWNHGILYCRDERSEGGARHIQDGIVPGYELFEYGFPVALPTEKVYGVRVELYEVDEHCIGRLDRLENNGVMFNRKTVTTADALECQMYIGSPDYFVPSRMRRVTPVDGVFDWKPFRSGYEEKETVNATV